MSTLSDYNHSTQCSSQALIDFYSSPSTSNSGVNSGLVTSTGSSHLIAKASSEGEPSAPAYRLPAACSYDGDPEECVHARASEAIVTAITHHPYLCLGIIVTGCVIIVTKGYLFPSTCHLTPAGCAADAAGA